MIEVILFAIGMSIIFVIAFYLLLKGIEAWWNRSEIKNDYEWKYLEPDTEEQIQPIEIWKNGKYSHTINVIYFTREQIARIREADAEWEKEQQ